MTDSSSNTRFKKLALGLRTIAGILVLSLVIQEVALAVSPALSPAAVTVPEELGDVRQRQFFSSPKLVINIQDAHAQLGAQEGIAKILDDLVKRYDLKLISLEGASDYVDTSLVSSFPDPEVREKTAKALLKSGQISAGEFYSMVSEKRVLLYGVEDKNLYENDLEAFRELADKRPAVQASLKKLRAIVASLESVYYPAELRSFLDAKRRFRHSSKGFGEYWKECRRLSGSLELPYENYPNLVKLNGVLDLESGIDFKKASRERETLIQELSRLLPKRSLDTLFMLALDYKKEKISAVRFHRSLVGLARELSLSLRDYPDLSAYAGYLERYEQIDFLGLLEELDQFESKLLDKLETTPQSRKLFALSERARLLTALLDVSLENADYEKYLSLNGNGPVESLRRELAELCRISGKKQMAFADYQTLEETLPAALKFYDYATKRNQALMANTLRRMEKENVRVAALITGGFHSDGLAKLLGEEKVSHLIVMPKFDDSSGERPYITVLTQKPKEYEAMFKDSDLYIAAPVLFDTAVSGARLAETTQEWKKVLVRVLAESYIKEGSLTSEKIGLYLQNVLGALPTNAPLSREDVSRYLRSLKFKEVLDPAGTLTGLNVQLFEKGVFMRPYEVFQVSIRRKTVDSIVLKNSRKERRFGIVPEIIFAGLLLAAFIGGLTVPVSAYALLFAFSLFRTSFEPGVLYCGVGIIITARRPEDGKKILPKRLAEDLASIARINLERGGQAVGFSISSRIKGSVEYIVKRTVNRKRGNLVGLGMNDFKRVVDQASTKGAKGTEVIVALEHSRYATQGDQNEKETQPHSGLFRKAKVYAENEAGEIVPDTQTVDLRGATNGDLDAFRMWGSEMTDLTTLRCWLERVNGSANGDQRTKIAARKRATKPIRLRRSGGVLVPVDTGGDNEVAALMMDFLTTQGMWDASLKAAYQFTVARSAQDAADGKELFTLVRDKRDPDVINAVRTQHKNTAPSAEKLAKWASVLEKTYETMADSSSSPGFEDRLVRELLGQKLFLRMGKDFRGVSELSAAEQERFVRTIVYFFLHNDPFEAMKLYVSRMDGTTGEGVQSSLYPQHGFVAAKGQPMFIGFDMENKYIAAVSEPRAVTDRLFRYGDGKDFPRGAYLLELKQRDGEIAQLGLDGIRVYSVRLGRELTKDELKNRLVSLYKNPYFKRDAIKKTSQDRVGDDIADIAKVGHDIDEDWAKSDSNNRQTANELGDLLIAKWKLRLQEIEAMVRANVDPRKRSMLTDLLVFGEENSAYVGEQFVADMKKRYPELNVRFAKANDFLLDPQEYEVGPETIVFGISQSGQTFSTQNATDYLNEKSGLERSFERSDEGSSFFKLQDHLKSRNVGNVFIMTGEYFSLMGLAIGQEYKADSRPINHIFTNGSGSRPSEPATVAVDAAHHTLTNLLYYLDTQLLETFQNGPSKPFGTALTQNDLKAFKQSWDVSNRMVSHITGVTEKMERIRTRQFQSITRAGAEASDVMTESIKSWLFLVVPTIYVAFRFGVTPISALLLPLVASILTPALLFFGVPTAVVSAIAAFIMIELVPVLATLLFSMLAFPSAHLWRFLRGRYHKDQVGGGKALTIVDYSPWVRRSLAILARKRFALSHSHATLSAVHAVDPNGLLHEHAPSLRRGSWIYAGVPDRAENSSIISRMKNATLMAISHTIGIQNWGTGPKIRLVSRLPLVKKKTKVTSLLTQEEAQQLEEYEKRGAKADHPALVDEMIEGRFDSRERFLAGVVYFYELSRKTSKLPIIGWDPSKTHYHARIQTTQSAVKPLAAPTKEDLDVFSAPGRRLRVVNSRGARLALSHPLVRAGFFVVTLLGWVMNPFSKAFAATASGVVGNVVNFSPDAGNSLWRIAQQMLGPDTSNQQVADRVQEMVAQNGIENPDLIYTTDQFHFDAGSNQDALGIAQNMSYTPPAPSPTPMPDAAPPSVDTPDTGVFEMPDFGHIFHEAINWVTNIPGGDYILIGLVVVAVVGIVGLAWKYRNALLNVWGSITDKKMLRSSVNTRLRDRVRTPVTAKRPDLHSFDDLAPPIRQDWRTSEEVVNGLPVPTSSRSGADVNRLNALLDDPSFAASPAGARLAGGFPPKPVAEPAKLEDTLRPLLTVGVVLASGQKPAEVEEYFSQLPGDKKSRFQFVFEQNSSPELFKKWGSENGVGLILDRPSLDNGDLQSALLKFLAETDEKTFSTVFPLLAQLTDVTARALEETEKRRVLQTLAAVLPPAEQRPVPVDIPTSAFGGTALSARKFDETLASVVTAQTGAEKARALRELNGQTDGGVVRVVRDLFSGQDSTQSGREQFLSSLGKSYALRFALNDPSYRIDLSKLEIPSVLSTPKTIVTDLDVFVKDAGGIPYALRIEHLKKKVPGAFEFSLLVRDASLKTREDVVTRWPETAIFGENEMIFAPGVLTAADLRKTAPHAFTSDASVILPSGLLTPEKTDDRKEGDGKIQLMELDPLAENATGILEADALVLQNEAVNLEGLTKKADGLWGYLPQVVPLGYKMLVEALTRIAMTERAA